MFFDEDANFARLLAELETWKGTPFVHNCAIKGSGVDCVRFAEQVLINVGAISPAVFPTRYVYRGGGPEMREIMETAIATVPQLDRVWRIENGTAPAEIKRGDMLMFSTGNAIHHLGIVGELPQLWHCMTK